jgi:RimJ/RimL family protein N-acetyltransferase
LIETERLLLRLPRREDADDLLEYAGDPEVTRWIGGQTGDRASTEAKIEDWLARWEANGIGHFVVVLDGKVLGRVGFVVWDSRSWELTSYAEAGEHAETELGWTLAQAHWGHGYAAEAARAARDWVHAERGIGRLVSLIHPDNRRSIRVAEKLGASPERSIETPGGPAVVWVHPRDEVVTKP